MRDIRFMIDNALDLFIYSFICWFFVVSFLFWFFVNTTGIEFNIFWIIIFFISIVLTALFLWPYKDLLNVKPKTVLSYILFFLFVVIVFVYYLEPTFYSPASSIGISMKDTHDGISAYIGEYGLSPARGEDVSKASFIINNKNSLWLGYPNVLHSISAFIYKIGFSVFNASWIAISAIIIINSFALFLIFKYLYRDIYLSAIISGLFGLSTFRLWFGAVTSIPMFFSIGLLIPAFCIFIVSTKQYRNIVSYMPGIVAISVIAASYTGPIILFLGMIFLYSTILFLQEKFTLELKRIGVFMLSSLPLLFITLLLQQAIYWTNVFPTKNDYDPPELSQHLLLLDKPLYMGFYLVGFILGLYSIWKNKAWTNSKYRLFLVLFIVNCVFLLLPVYDFIFHLLKGATTIEERWLINPEGLFGGLNHQKASRLALVQPFFFIFIFPVIFVFIRRSFLRYTIAFIMMLSFMFLRIDLPLYQYIQPGGVRDYYYNAEDLNKRYSLLSDFRLVLNKQIWTEDIWQALSYIKEVYPDEEAKILVANEVDWKESTVVLWGSVYLHKRLYGAHEQGLDIYSNSDIDSKNLRTSLINKDIKHIVFSVKDEEIKKTVLDSVRWTKVARFGDVYLLTL